MPYADDGTWIPENKTTAERVTDITAKNSPMMQQAKTQAKQASNRRGLLNSTMAVQAGQAATYNAALPIAQQDSSQAQQSNMSKQGYQQSRGLLTQELDSREKLASDANEKDIAIANMNVIANDRQQATGALTQMESIYSNMFNSLAGNENIPAASRDAYMTHIGALRDSNLGLVEQMFNINLQWGSSNSTPAIA